MNLNNQVLLLQAKPDPDPGTEQPAQTKEEEKPIKKGPFARFFDKKG